MATARKPKRLDLDKITTAAIRTAKWATTMTKWRIGFETRGRRLQNLALNRHGAPKWLRELWT